MPADEHDGDEHRQEDHGGQPDPGRLRVAQDAGFSERVEHERVQQIHVHRVLTELRPPLLATGDQHEECGAQHETDRDEQQADPT